MSIFCNTYVKHKITTATQFLTKLVGLFVLTYSLVFAQVSPKLSVLEIDKQIKNLLDPVKGLNNEIRSGLQKIEQTCNIIAKSKLEETKKQALSFSDPQTIAMRSEISSAKQITIDQNEFLSKYLQEARIKVAPLAKTCDGITAIIKTSDSCATYKTVNEAINHVNDAAIYYYGEALARFSSYETAYDLEQKGCTRPGFSSRLWSAEQIHLMPTMKTSAQSLLELLK